MENYGIVKFIYQVNRQFQRMKFSTAHFSELFVCDEIHKFVIIIASKLWKGFNYNGNVKASYYKNDFSETTAEQIFLYQTSNLSCEDDTPYFKYWRKVDTEPSGGQVLPPLPPVFIDITVGALTTPHVVYWLPHEGHYNKTRIVNRELE